MNESHDTAQAHARIVDAVSADRDHPPTGDDAVDAALAGLAPLADAPLREHLVVFSAVNDALQDRLADTEG